MSSGNAAIPLASPIYLSHADLQWRLPPPSQPSVNMHGFYSKLDSSSSSSPLLGMGLGGEGGAPLPLSLAVETEKAQALLQTFSSASLLASAGLGMFCVLADHILQLPITQHHLWMRATLDNATHGLVGLWSWAVVIGLRKKSDLYEVLLAGLLASIIDLDHFYMAGSLSLKVSVFCCAFNVPRRSHDKTCGRQTSFRHVRIDCVLR